MLVPLFFPASRSAAAPFFFSQMNKDNKNQIYVKVMNAFIGLVCVVFLLVALNIDVFKHFIQNESYWIGLRVVPILLLANVFLGVYYNQSIWYKLSGKTKFGAYIALSGAFLTVLINVLFIPKYGYMACAYATLIVYLFQMLLSYFLGQKHYPIPYNIWKFLLYLGSALALYFFAIQIDFESFYLNLFFRNSILLIFIISLFYFEKKKDVQENPSD
ncbi:MAG: hypothetical protein CL855_07085 [Cryomorphaceae bacterium]|nr:hypothetical protein [Cryomorphaceae bacterium]